MVTFIISAGVFGLASGSMGNAVWWNVYGVLIFIISVVILVITKISMHKN